MGFRLWSTIATSCISTRPCTQAGPSADFASTTTRSRSSGRCPRWRFPSAIARGQRSRRTSTARPYELPVLLCATDARIPGSGSAPPSNGYLTREDLSRPETFFPLKLFVCAKCWLVQTEDYACASDLFSADYAYYSSTSTSWLKHARTYSKMITQRLGLSSRSFVVEVAANDGYLLQNFVSAGIRCLGVEPTSGTAAVARQKGITICEDYFGEKLGDQLLQRAVVPI